MKTAFFISFLLLFTLSLSAQSQAVNNVEREQQYANLLNITPTSAPARSFDNRYRGVQGTPYLFDDYRKALIINTQGDTIRGLDVRLNLVGAYVEVKALGGIHGNVTFDNFSSIEMENLVGQTEYFKTVVIAEELMLLEVIYNGNIKLYRQLKKGFQKADYRGAYSAEKPYDEYVDQFAYYVITETGDYQKVRLKAKSLIKALPQHKAKIQQFFKTKEVTHIYDLRELFAQL